MSQEHHKSKEEKQLSYQNTAVYILKFTLLGFNYKNPVAWKNSILRGKKKTKGH